MGNDSVLFIVVFGGMLVVYTIIGTGIYLYLRKKGYYDSPKKKLGFKEDEKILHNMFAQYRVKEFLDDQNVEDFTSSNKELVEVRIIISDKNNLAIKESEKDKRLFFYNSNNKPRIKEIKMGDRENDMINGYVEEEEQTKLLEFQDLEKRYQLYVLKTDTDKILKLANK